MLFLTLYEVYFILALELFFVKVFAKIYLNIFKILKFIVLKSAPEQSAALLGRRLFNILKPFTVFHFYANPFFQMIIIAYIDIFWLW